MASYASLPTGHPITRVAALTSTAAANAVTLVCAGGATVSVQPALRWVAASGEGGVNSSRGTGSNISSYGGGVGVGGTAAAIASGQGDSGKGAETLWAALQPHPLSSASPSAILSEQQATLESGEVTALCVAAVPGTDVALAVVGSTVGTVALFLVEGSHSLRKIAECPLLRWSGGRVTAADAVVDVAFSMDPAGRPEFVSAASAGSIVIVDVQRFYHGGADEGDAEDEEGAASGSSNSPSQQFSSNMKRESTSGLRARAMAALESPHASSLTLRRRRSDTFTCAFAAANVVRVLAPQRLHAAAAMDVALVVVLSDGAVHYVERVVEGGAVRLLAEHHQRRLAKGAAFIAYGQEVTTAAASTRVAWEHDARALPHVVYRYRLSSVHFNVCRMARGGGAAAATANGFGGAAAAAVVAVAAMEGVTVVNDAALVFSEKAGVCHVVVAGTQLSPAGRVAGRHTSPAAAAAATVAGGSLSSRAAGWWAVVHNAVLPRGTLDRAALERQALQNLQRSQQDATTTSSSADLATVYSSDAGSPFMVHVQSSVTALPAAVSSGGSAAAAAAAAAGAIGSPAGHDGVTHSPVACSPTGTGAHLAAGPTSAGLGGGFSAAAVVGSAVVLSAGAEVLVGDVKDTSPHTRTLPALRLVRPFGAAVEALASGPYQDGRTVLVASGSRVVSVPL